MELQSDGKDYGTQDIRDETWWVPPGSASVFEATFPESDSSIRWS